MIDQSEPVRVRQVAAGCDPRSSQPGREPRLGLPGCSPHKPDEHLGPHLRRVRVADVLVEDAPEAITRPQVLIGAHQPTVQAHELHQQASRRRDLRSAQERPGRDEREHPLAVKVPEQAIDEVVNAVLPELSVRDEVLVAGQAGHGHHGRDTLVHGCEPPGSGTAHAHASGPMREGVYFRAAAEVVERDLVVSNEHAPEGTTEPEVEFEQVILLGPAPLRRPDGPVPTRSPCQ